MKLWEIVNAVFQLLTRIIVSLKYVTSDLETDNQKDEKKGKGMLILKGCCAMKHTAL
jgi:hypothetical protein